MRRGDADNAFGGDRPLHAAEAFGAPRQRSHWWNRGGSQPAPRTSTAYREPPRRPTAWQQTAAPPVVARTPTTSADPVGQALKMFDQWAQTMSRR
ncbi:MAG: hypothetical protein V9E83_00360 [Baekduia sp.]